MIAPRIRISVVGLLASATLATLVASAPVVQARPATQRTSFERRAPDPLRDQMLSLVNRTRRLRGLPVLRLDRRLSREALAHSRKMAQARAISHTPNLASIISSAGGTVFGENVGRGRSLHGIRDAWLRHGDTRNILLDGRFHHVALGVLHADGFFWVTLQAFD